MLTFFSCSWAPGWASRSWPSASQWPSSHWWDSFRWLFGPRGSTAATWRSSGITPHCARPSCPSSFKGQHVGSAPTFFPSFLSSPLDPTDLLLFLPATFNPIYCLISLFNENEKHWCVFFCPWTNIDWHVWHVCTTCNMMWHLLVLVLISSNLDLNPGHLFC